MMENGAPFRTGHMMGPLAAGVASRSQSPCGAPEHRRYLNPAPVKAVSLRSGSEGAKQPKGLEGREHRACMWDQRHRVTP